MWARWAVRIGRKWRRSFLRAEPSAHTACLCPPAAKHPEDVCAPTQFRCVSTNTCISASFHCDEESDCPDRSDEFGCSEQGAGGRAGVPGLASLGWVPGAPLHSLSLASLPPDSSEPLTPSSSLCPSHPSLLLPSPSAPPGGDPSPGDNPGLPGPDSDLHLCGHRRPHPYHQLAAQLGPHPLSSQVQLWAWAGAGTIGESGPRGPGLTPSPFGGPPG